MSINDLLDMDLLPIVAFLGIIGAIFAVIGVVWWRPTYHKMKADFENRPITSEYGLKVIQKDMGEQKVIGGTLAFPIKGYQCTFVFEKEDGSRLILKTSKAEIYETILVGDIGDVKYKNNNIDNILIDYIHKK